MASHFKKEGIPLLRTKNVKEFYIDLESDPIYIGNACIVPNTFPVANSADIILMNPNKELLPEYLTAFINSKYGQFQIERGSSGGIQGHMNLYSLEKLSIPVLGITKQTTIKNIVLLGLKELEKSKSFYNQAEKLLLEELGLKDFKPKEDLSFVVNYSDVKKVDRMDADYFQPKYAELIKKLGKKEKLSKIAKRKTNLIKINKEGEYKYIEISDINVGNGEVASNEVLGKDLPANAKIKINGGELIVSKVRPTRGAISIIPDNWQENYVASGAFSVFEITSPEREFLQVVLRSIIGKLQIEKPTTGTSYPTVTDEDVGNVLIPVLPKNTQQKIADLVRKSHEARKKSKELLNEAKRKVEEMIEKGDKK